MENLVKASLAGLFVLNTLLANAASAALISHDRDDFLGSYALVNPTGGAIGEGLTDTFGLASGHIEVVGNMVLDPDANIRWGATNWSNQLPDNEIGISYSDYGPDDSFVFGFIEQVTEFGFDMYGSGTEFEVRVFGGNTLLDTYQFSHANGLGFVGISAATGFDRVEVEELIKSDANQYYGSFVMTNLGNPAPVPEPSSLALLGLTVFGLGARRLKKKTA
ncbi:PEP-CTERM sorting domain-containing protein [Thalassomonas viridans]|uniref:PEP-CTERM sorting domain-containing protein n=1 Tax=Thalassomonas viridans TaxID=137584 RepID=A0AAE9YZH1_9GAMM|nr:PEP-CTERM sorting domain-containing protein [Thalassomonas viridans]WDE03835.1 PEP-CTERM sorting domain-containing protein [Thalassomonas viridans]